MGFLRTAGLAYPLRRPGISRRHAARVECCGSIRPSAGASLNGKTVLLRAPARREGCWRPGHRGQPALPGPPLAIPVRRRSSRSRGSLAACREESFGILTLRWRGCVLRSYPSVFAPPSPIPSIQINTLAIHAWPTRRLPQCTWRMASAGVGAVLSAASGRPMAGLLTPLTVLHTTQVGTHSTPHDRTANVEGGAPRRG